MESITSEDVYSPGKRTFHNKIYKKTFCSFDLFEYFSIFHQGDQICLASQARSGYGTYTRDGYIYASLLGQAKLEREASSQSSSSSSSNEKTTQWSYLILVV